MKVLLSKKQSMAVPNAFSLIELLVVISLILILIAISFPLLSGMKKRAHHAQAYSEMAGLHIALSRYQKVYGDYPDIHSIQDSVRATLFSSALRGEKNGKTFVQQNKSFFVKDLHYSLDESGRILDPWGFPYFYAYDSNWNHGQYFLFSCGEDGVLQINEEDGTYDTALPVNLDNLEAV